jgi:photosystem II stability/assembly factor-like uncharacterized protein
MNKKMFLLCGVWACLGFIGLGAVSDDPPFSPPSESRTIIGPYGGDIRGLDANPATPKEIYAVSYNRGQVFRSTNSGETWTSIAAFDYELFDVAAAPSNPNVIYALGKERIIKSSDKGATWKEYEFGTRRYATGHIIIHAKDPNEVYVAGYFQTDPNRGEATCPAFLKSQNGGKTWTVTKVSTNSLSGSMTCLALSKNHPAVFYAGTTWRNAFYKYYYGFCRSDDGGQSWKDISPDLDGAACDAAVDPDDPNRVFLAASTTIWRSENGGSSWATTKLQPLTALGMNPALPQVLYAGGSGLIYRSLDGGLHWTQPQACGGSAQDFLFGSGRVLAATSNGIFRSDNSGSSWKASHQGLSAMNITTLAVAPSSSQVLYTAVSGCGLYRSGNGGKTWLRTGTGSPCDNIISLAVCPENPDWLFATASG